MRLSQNEAVTLADGARLVPYLGTAQARDQRPEWDTRKKEGLLQFGMYITHTAKDYETYGVENLAGAASLYTCDTAKYLFTKVNQRDLDEGYANGEASIFLRSDDKEIEVGKYRAPVSGAEFETWIHPSLCEGDKASLCRVAIVAKRVSKESERPVSVAEMRLYLKDDAGKETLAFTAKSATKPTYENFKYFGCEE